MAVVVLNQLNWIDFQASRDFLWTQKSPQQALDALPVSPLGRDLSELAAPLRALCVDLAGEAYLQLKDAHRARLVYREHKRWEHVAFCSVALGDWASVRHAVEQLDSKHSWSVILESAAKGELQQWPSFLHLRNRLEGDIYTLYQLEAFDVLDNLLAYLSSFSQLNNEVFKLAGRTLITLGLHVQAGNLIKRAIEINPVDAESYYHRAQLYIACKQPRSARLLLKQVILMSPRYIPAYTLMNDLG